MKTQFDILMKENIDDVKQSIASHFGISKSDGKLRRCDLIPNCQENCLAYRKDGKCYGVVREYLDKPVTKCIIPKSFIEKFNRLV